MNKAPAVGQIWISKNTGSIVKVTDAHSDCWSLIRLWKGHLSLNSNISALSWIIDDFRWWELSDLTERDIFLGSDCMKCREPNKCWRNELLCLNCRSLLLGAGGVRVKNN